MRIKFLSMIVSSLFCSSVFALDCSTSIETSSHSGYRAVFVDETNTVQLFENNIAGVKYINTYKCEYKPKSKYAPAHSGQVLKDCSTILGASPEQETADSGISVHLGHCRV